MTRRLVLVEIDAPTPLAAERMVGSALVNAGGNPFVQQTRMEVMSIEEEMAHFHDLLPGADFDCLDAVLLALHRNTKAEEGDFEVVFARTVAAVSRVFQREVVDA